MSMIAESYAQALYTLAKDEALDTVILQQIETLRDAFAEEPDYVRLLGSYNLSKDVRCGIVDDSFRGHVHAYVLNFLKILTEKGCIRQFSACVSSYRRLYNEDHGILSVLAVSAVALTDEQSKRLQDKLERITGKKILLQNKIDTSCLGGICLDYDGIRMDGTVKNRLDTIAGLLKNTVL